MALLSFKDGVSVGNLPFATWDEISGLTRAQKSVNRPCFWAVDDGIIAPIKILAVDSTTAANSGEFTLVASTGVDLEDIASATVTGQPYIYVGDIGNNANTADKRGAGVDLAIYRIKEPNIWTVPTSTYPFGDELIRYQFENDIGAVVNSGTGSTTYNSTFQGNTAYSANPILGSYGVTFDGVSDAIDSKFGSGRNPSSAPFSISCWAKRTVNTAADQHLFGVSASPASDRCYVRYRQAVGKWGMRVQGQATVESAIDVTINTWYHVCLVMDGSTARLYINGTQVATSAYTSYTLPGPIYVGNIWLTGSADPAQGWQGHIDEYATYTRALSAAEVLNISNKTASSGALGGSLTDGVDYERIRCIFPAGNYPTHRDTETILADPDTGDIYFLTKRNTQIGAYKLAHATSYSGIQTLTYLGTIYQLPFSSQAEGPTDGGRVVGGDITPDGTEIILKNYSDVYIFPRDKGTQSIYQALSATPTLIPAYVGGGQPSSHPNNEPQGESVLYDWDGANFYTASEGVAAFGSTSSAYPLFKYERLGVSLTSGTLQQGTSSYSGAVDTYLWSLAGSDSQVRGAENVITIDYNSGTDERYGLLKFDLSSIPSDATIYGCDLVMYIDEAGSNFRLHKMLETWDGNTTKATLGHLPAFNNIQAATTADAIHTGYAGVTGLVKVKVPIATIQAWVSGSVTNNGWVLYNNDVSGNGFNFRSSDYATVGDRPMLVVRYYAVTAGGGTTQVFKIISANPIKNGGAVVLGTKKGTIQSMDDQAVNTPAIVDIEEKYSDRFDDERYYDGDDDE